MPGVRVHERAVAEVDVDPRDADDARCRSRRPRAGDTVTISQSVQAWVWPSGSEKVGASMWTSAAFSTMLSVPGSVIVGVFGGVALAAPHRAKKLR